MRKNEIKKVRCCIYTRKSIEEGLDMSFNTLDAQRDAGESYIASQRGNGWICLPEHYDDGGFSGGNIDRPALNRMKEDIIAGKIDMVVVYKLGRLSRSLLDFFTLQQFFEQYNVSFCSVTQPIDTSTSAGKMMLNILMSFGEYERMVIAERTRDKMAASKKRGIWMGGYVPYGFQVKEKKLYAHPEEAPVVRRIFKRFTEIQSPKQIAYELNEDGIRPRTGKLWTSPYISRILANHTYVGEVLFKGEITKGEHEGIITRKVWDRVREITASNVPYDHSQGMAELTTPLKGILRCGHCGCAMKPVFTTKGKKRYCYYYCDQDTKRGEKTCPVGKIGSATIEEAVLEESKKIFKSPYFLEKVSAKTGLSIPEVRESFSESFWAEITEQELNRLYAELFERVVLKENQLIYDIKTSGVQNLIEGVMQ